MKSMFNRIGNSPEDSSQSYEETPQALSLETILEKVYPCQPKHPYLSAKGIAEHSADLKCGVYTGFADIDGVQCNNAFVLQAFDVDGQLVNFQFIVPMDDGTFAELWALPDNVEGCFARIGKPNGTILVVQDWASGVPLHCATGHAVAVALTLQNVVLVCEALAAKYPDVKIVVCGSDDGNSPNSTLHVAIQAAKGIGAVLALPQFSSRRQGKPSGFNDLFRHEGLDAIRRCVDSAADPASDTGPLAARSEIKRLAALALLEYEQQRTKSAKSLLLRPKILDALVEEERASQSAKAKADYADITSAKIWPQPVDGNELAAQICWTITRFTVLPPYSVVAMTLWIIFAHLAHVVQVSPILALLSPVKRCGKTTALRLVELLTPRPLTASNITPAALFRTVQVMTPTLLIDEADTFIRKSEELNGIINSGHTRANAYVIRMEDGEPVSFSTWCAKAIAMIGEPPETMHDRSIAIHLRRKRPDERVEPLRFASMEEFSELNSKIARWASDNAAQVMKQRPVPLGISNDRAQDNWEPLLLIASSLGRDWLNKAISAAVEISNTHDDFNSLDEELLLDIRYIFESRDIDKIQTTVLIESLCADDERPWRTYARGRPMSPRDISALLKKFDIRSKNMRYGRGVAKGYEAEQFKDAFARYLPNRWIDSE